MENKSEIITDYLAGKLGRDEEEKLFDSIAADSGLREEFRNTLAIDRAIRDTANSFTPPASLTNSIFAEIAKQAVPTPVPTKPASGFNWIAGLGSAVVGSIITIAAVFSIYYFGSKSDVTEINPSVRETIASTPSNPTTSFETNKPLRSSLKKKGVESDYNLNNTAYSNKYNSSLRTLPQVQLRSASTAVNEGRRVAPQIPLPSVQNPKIDISRPVLVKVDGLDYNSGRFSLDQIKYNPIDLAGGNGEYLFSVELRGSLSKNLPKQTLNPQKFSPLNNFSAALYWLAGDKLALGVEARGETFFLQYNGVDGIGRRIEYEQTPNIATIGVAGRYFPIRMGFLAPFAQLSLGYSAYGSSVRPGIGAELEITPRLSVNLSGEWSAFFFQHQSNFFQANKLNLNSGINFKF